jgi:predicted ester cyclase
MQSDPLLEDDDRAAIPDARITVEQQLAEGDLVAARWSGRGAHEGELMDIEPTGKRNGPR